MENCKLEKTKINHYEVLTKLTRKGFKIAMFLNEIQKRKFLPKF